MQLITGEFDGFEVAIVYQHFGDDVRSFVVQLVVGKILK